MSRTRRTVQVLAAAAATGVLLTAGLAAPAAADPPPIDGAPCAPSQLGQKVWYTEGATMNIKPVVTDSLAINVAPGTTGSRTDTLQETEVVTRQVTNSAGVEVTASAEAGVLFAKVSTSVKANYNYSVVTTGSRTTTKTTTMTWNFNEPGYYGLYRGVQEVSGLDGYTECQRNPYPNVPYGWRAVNLWYSAFTSPEEGTILCTGPATDTPDLFIRTVRELARKRLGDC